MNLAQNKITIHTFNSRELIFWDAIRDHLNLTLKQMHVAISSQYQSLTHELSLKRIDYKSLKNSLIPQKDRFELCLFFDTQKIHDMFYGGYVFDKVLPILPPSLNCSVHCGDLIGQNEHQEVLYQLMNDHVELIHDTEYQNSVQYFLVHVNNLTESGFVDIVKSIANEESCIGFMDCTHSSHLKSHFSGCIGQYFLKSGDTLILRDTEDEITEKNTNPHMIEYQNYGFKIKSISNLNYSSFLTYKIERQVLTEFETDNIFGLASVSRNPLKKLSDIIHISESKFQYLLSNKIDSLSRFDVQSLGIEGLRHLISLKLKSNYFYNYEYLIDHDTVKFNIMIEIASKCSREPKKYMVGLKLNFSEQRIELVTMY